jgi:uncharacterized protein
VTAAVALPLPLRNRLAELILDALHDRAAREGLRALVAVCADPAAPEGARPPDRFPLDFFERGTRGLVVRSGFAAHALELTERATAAWRVVRDRARGAEIPSLAETLDAAAALFDVGLFFEVHELLEPCWFRAVGREREALQGLIQVAVGFQHLVNGNRRGALALLHDGAAKAAAGAISDLPLADFAAGARRCGAALAALGDAEGSAAFDRTLIPAFPRSGAARR